MPTQVFSFADNGPPGYTVLRRRTVLGKGRAIFQRATEAMFKYEMIDRLSWAKMVVLPDSDELATVVRCFGCFWSFNPSRQVCAFKNRRVQVADLLGGGARPMVSQVAYSTLEGHLIAGEERFRVVLDTHSGSVTFEALSFTRGAGWLGRVAMPLIRPLQHNFFRETGRAMLAAVQTEES